VAGIAGVGLVGLIFAISSPLVLAESDRQVALPEQHRTFLNAYCLECHGAEKPEGEVRLDGLRFEISEIETAERWQKILNVLNTGEMPPEKAKQPAPAEKTLFLDDLSHTMVAARRKLSDRGGVITMRRLNRREYENTIRDLLGVTVNVKSLPSDVGAGGFDTVGKSLFFSSDQFEQYLTIARTALEEVMVNAARPIRQSEHRECEESARPALSRALEKLLEQQKNGELALATGDSKK